MLQASSTLMVVGLPPLCSYLLILKQNRLVGLEVVEGDSLASSDRKLAVDCSFDTCLTSTIIIDIQRSN